MFILCMETTEITIVKEDHPLNEFRLRFLKAAAEVFLVLSCGSVKYLNPWIIKHSNLTFGTG